MHDIPPIHPIQEQPAQTMAVNRVQYFQAELRRLTLVALIIHLVRVFSNLQVLFGLLCMFRMYIEKDYVCRRKMPTPSAECLRIVYNVHNLQKPGNCMLQLHRIYF